MCESEFDKHLLGILNQHGIEAMLEVVHDEIYRSVEEAYNNGEHVGWCDCYDTYQAEIERDDDF